MLYHYFIKCVDLREPWVLFLSIRLVKHFDADKDSSLLVVRRVEINKRIMVNMLSVLSMFIVCTLPSRLISIVMGMPTEGSHHLNLALQFLSYVLFSLQGTLNPILYSMLAKQWRRNMTNELRTVFHKSSGLIRFLSSERSY